MDYKVIRPTKGSALLHNKEPYVLFVQVFEFPENLGKQELALALGINDQLIYVARRQEATSEMKDSPSWRITGVLNHPELSQWFLGHTNSFSTMARAMVAAETWYAQNPIFLPSNNLLVLQAIGHAVVVIGGLEILFWHIAVSQSLEYALSLSQVVVILLFGRFLFATLLLYRSSNSGVALGHAIGGVVGILIGLVLWGALSLTHIIKVIIDYLT